MNSFCRNLWQCLSERLIEVDVLVSKKEKILQMSLMKPLISYEVYKEIIAYFRRYWNGRKKFFPEYFFFILD